MHAIFDFQVLYAILNQQNLPIHDMGYLSAIQYIWKKRLSGVLMNRDG